MEFLSDDWFVAANEALHGIDIGETQLVVAHVLGDRSLHIALSGGRASIGHGTNGADVTLQQPSEVATAVREGSLSALTAIQKGLIVVEGDVRGLMDAADALGAVDKALNELT